MPILSELALPTMDDLPSEFEGEEALPDEFHAFLAYLLIETFRPPKFLPDRYFSALDMYLYYQAQPTLHGLRPDWFGVVDVPLLREGRQRTSFVVWEEKATPLIIVEALSPGTTRNDLGRGALPAQDSPTKWEVYEQHLKVPYYVTVNHHRRPAEVRFFRHDGVGLREVTSGEGRLWLPEAGLGIGIWRGRFKRLEGDWVRFYDAEGRWLPTDEERAAAEQAAKERERAEKELAWRQAEQERLAKEAALAREQQERAEKERLAAKLRTLGIDPETP
ncbi:hypothetical protein J8C06_06250 [Chloracidobacterium validum]|uniref:Restriction endonuclease domain-containing protein n=1 Tax=Chloracidobacterium validum TaxID=2821543 RepID=A0ABX8B8P4_9BACT|nr:Uma2 family endonuclease [Chloracidobacterium validum]QUW01978.1 hypothetical protein J8C06_06250 [Chloracidobacterium validum]